MPPQGPIGLLLFRAHCYAMALSDDWRLHQAKETSFSILNCPIQFLKPLVRQRVVRARAAFVCLHRSYLQGCEEIDFEPIRSRLQSQEANERRILSNHLTLAGWDDHKLAQLDRVEEGGCVCRCGHPKPDKMHKLKHCPLLTQARNGDNEKVISDLLKLGLPDHLFLGILIPCLRIPILFVRKGEIFVKLLWINLQML